MVNESAQAFFSLIQMAAPGTMAQGKAVFLRYLIGAYLSGPRQGI
jgi:hypothetical protein